MWIHVNFAIGSLRASMKRDFESLYCVDVNMRWILFERR